LNDAKRPRWTTGWPGALLAALAIFGLYLFLASRASIRDRDEGWYGRAAVEMAASGNYLYPTFNGEPFLEKPILMYWLMALAVKVLGPTELACRLFATAGVSASCLLTWWIGRRLFDARTGLWAMTLTAASLLMLVVGPMALTDSILLACEFAAMACFAAAIRSGPSFLQLLGLALASGLAMLAKGPMGLAPLATIGTALWLGRKSLSLGRGYFLASTAAVVAGSAIYFTWAFLVDSATGGEYFRTGLGKHVVERLVSPLQGHGGASGSYFAFLPYYLPVVLIGFFPWVLHLGGAASALLGGRIGDPASRAFIAAAILPLAVVVTLMATKLPHYILPIWLGLSLAVAATIEGWRAGRLADRDRTWLRRGVWLFGALGVTGGLAVTIGPWLVTKPDLRLGGAVSGALVLALTAAGIWIHLVHGPAASARLLAGGMAAAAAVVGLMISPGIEEAKGVPRFAARLKAAIAPGAPLATYGYHEPSMNFYLDRQLLNLDPRGPRGVVQWLAEGADGALIVTAERLQDLAAIGFRPPPGTVIVELEILNFGKFGWVSLIAIRRGLPRDSLPAAPQEG
jgi:4-amino-4-deoxy-L-arabinose transferase-like glycosyltransferase